MPLSLIILLGFVGTFLSVWGSQTIGSWSNNVAIIGGLIWLTSAITAFLNLGFLNGLYFLIGTFILGALLKNILPHKI